MRGWIGVDLDGTLAVYQGWTGSDQVGPPVENMIERVKRWIEQGKEVRIFTARAWLYDTLNSQLALFMDRELQEAVPDTYTSLVHTRNKEYVEVIKPIEDWCLKHLGKVLQITSIKDYSMVELWDDRAIGVKMNTGKPWHE